LPSQVSHRYLGRDRALTHRAMAIATTEAQRTVPPHWILCVCIMDLPWPGAARPNWSRRSSITSHTEMIRNVFSELGAFRCLFKFDAVIITACPASLSPWWCAPERASLSTMAAPIPLVDPVTIATLPNMMAAGWTAADLYRGVCAEWAPGHEISGDGQRAEASQCPLAVPP
jgi:hypothetical protein